MDRMTSRASVERVGRVSISEASRTRTGTASPTQIVRAEKPRLRALRPEPFDLDQAAEAVARDAAGGSRGAFGHRAAVARATPALASHPPPAHEPGEGDNRQRGGHRVLDPESGAHPSPIRRPPWNTTN